MKILLKLFYLSLFYFLHYAYQKIENYVCGSYCVCFGQSWSRTSFFIEMATLSLKDWKAHDKPLLLLFVTHRHFKEEKTSPAHSTAPASEAPGELSDGTHETLTQLLPWFFLVPTMGKLHSKEKPIKSSSPNETLTNNSRRKKMARDHFLRSGGIT